MPELPDVEVFSRHLRSTALHKKITAVEVRSAKILSGVSAGLLARALRGRSLEAARRHGKYLFVRMDDDGWLLLHFGMTGRLRYFEGRDKESPHDRLLIRFSNGYSLAYESLRMLGKVGLTEAPDSFVREKGIGPDALHLDFELFDRILDERRASIKSVLMNQKNMAGIGNVYSDEILFHARIHPGSRAGALKRRQRKKVFDSMIRVLTTAIGCKADADNFPGSFLSSRRREGEKCPRCRGHVERSGIAGRSSYYCPACQRRYN